jgi:hypothetical protein
MRKPRFPHNLTELRFSLRVVQLAQQLRIIVLFTHSLAKEKTSASKGGIAI